MCSRLCVFCCPGPRDAAEQEGENGGLAQTVSAWVPARLCCHGICGSLCVHVSLPFPSLFVSAGAGFLLGTCPCKLVVFVSGFASTRLLSGYFPAPLAKRAWLSSPICKTCMVIIAFAVVNAGQPKTPVPPPPITSPHPCPPSIPHTRFGGSLPKATLGPGHREGEQVQLAVPAVRDGGHSTGSSERSMRTRPRGVKAAYAAGDIQVGQEFDVWCMVYPGVICAFPSELLGDVCALVAVFPVSCSIPIPILLLLL